MANDERRTPADLFDQLDREFHFTLDAAAHGGIKEGNARRRYYMGPGATGHDLTANGAPALCLAPDAIAADWRHDNGQCRYASVAFCNPPYSRGNLWKFTEHAADEAQAGHCTAVLLVPGDFSTEWWRWQVEGRASEVRMIHKRVKFDGLGSGAKFPTAVVIYRRRVELAYPWTRRVPNGMEGFA